MPKNQDNCCAGADELRVIRFEPTGIQPEAVYTVPAGKVFVITSWTIGTVNQSGVATRLWRDGDPVGEHRLWEAVRQYSHATYPTGIAFSAGQTIRLENFGYNPAYHFLYGYEVDA